MFSSFLPTTNIDIQEYVLRVLENRDRGRRIRVLSDSKALDYALDHLAVQIAEKIKPDYEKTSLHVPHPAPPSGDQVVTVHNYGGNIVFQCHVHAPKSLQEVIDLFVRANKENVKIRAVGAFHSWSPICQTDGFLLQTNHLAGLSPADTTYWKDPTSASSFYDVLCGTRIRDLARELEKYGRALRTMGGCTALHMVGISCTGAHGSGIAIPPIADIIRGVTLVSANFSANGLPIVYRIEPTNGVTDPKKPIPNVTLVQDDATFHAVIVGLGAFGFVYSVTIDTVPFYWIKQTREVISWSEVKKQLSQGPSGELLKYHTCEIVMNPYSFRSLVSKRELIAEEPADVGKPNMNPFVTLVQSIPAFEKIWKLVSKPNGPVDNLAEDAGNLIGIILKHFPLLVSTFADRALDIQNHSGSVVGKYYDIYDIGYESRFPAISCEITYPMNTYQEGVDATFSALQKARQKSIKNTVAGFLHLRFSAPSSATIAMANNHIPSPEGARSYLEIYGITKFYDNVDTYDEIVKPIQEQAVNKLLARLHWGQHLASGFKAEQYKKKDPKFAANIAAVRKLADKYDPKHIMRNAYLENVVFTT